MIIDLCIMCCLSSVMSLGRVSYTSDLLICIVDIVYRTLGDL